MKNVRIWKWAAEVCVALKQAISLGGILCVGHERHSLGLEIWNGAPCMTSLSSPHLRAYLFDPGLLSGNINGWPNEFKLPRIFVFVL